LFIEFASQKKKSFFWKEIFFSIFQSFNFIKWKRLTIFLLWRSFVLMLLLNLTRDDYCLFSISSFSFFSFFRLFRLRSRFLLLSRLLSEIELTRWTTNVVFVFIISFDIIIFICTRSNRENNRSVEFLNVRSFAVAEIFFVFTCILILKFINFISYRRFFAFEKRSRDFIIFDSWTFEKWIENLCRWRNNSFKLKQS
jgi:hypothetical protein